MEVLGRAAISIQLAALDERFHVLSACMNLVRRLSLSAARAASSGSIELSKNRVEPPYSNFGIISYAATIACMGSQRRTATGLLDCRGGNPPGP